MNLDMHLLIAWLFLIVGLLTARYSNAGLRPEVSTTLTFHLSLCRDSVVIFCVGAPGLGQVERLERVILAGFGPRLGASALPNPLPWRATNCVCVSRGFHY
jgi:hypothetical protein